MRCFVLERTLTDEEKIRKAIEISERRNQHYTYQRPAKDNVNKTKNYRLFKRMASQMLICLLIYFVFYSIHTNQYFFSEDIMDKTSSILNYDINFAEWYSRGREFINSVGAGLVPAQENEEEGDQQENANENTNIIEKKVATDKVKTESTVPTENKEVIRCRGRRLCRPKRANEERCQRSKEGMRISNPTKRKDKFRIWSKGINVPHC